MIQAIVIVVCLASGLGSLPALAQGMDVTEGCLPPAEPFLPEDDAALAQYANLIAEDFERYFGVISDYFACMDATREVEFRRAQQVSQRHRQFLDRLDGLGLRSKAAVGREP
jgi:hypothetical protein